MKKKIAVVALALSLVAIAALGSTLAWFTSEDSVTNTFEIGEVKIVQHENERDEYGVLVDFTQNQMLLPVVNGEKPASDANYIEKLVSVEGKGKNEAYVRTFIAVPATLVDIIHLDVNVADGWSKDDKDWVKQTVEFETIVDGKTEKYKVDYRIFSFTYKEALSKDEKTPFVLEGVYMDAAVDVKTTTVNGEEVRQFCTRNEDGSYTFYNFDISKPIKVLVATQACQAAGFENGAADAIDTAFGNTAPDFTKVNP